MKEKKKIVRLENEYRFRVYDIGRPRTPIGLHPRVFATGDAREIERLYARELAEFREQVGRVYTDVPYVFPRSQNRFFGDWGTKVGEQEFWDTVVRLAGEFQPPYSVRDLWTFAALKQNQRFGRHRDHCACLRGLDAWNGRPELSVGASMYEEAARTMGSEGITIGLSRDDRARLIRELEAGDFKDLCRLARKLERRFGRGASVRSAIHRTFGNLPSFDHQVYCHMLGVAAVLLTADEECVFVLRTPRTASVNHGVNVAVSGGVEYRADEITRFGLPLHLIHEVLREAKEEIGVDGADLTVVPLGFVRELPRGGSPEFLFLLRYRGKAKGVVESMRDNRRPDQDVDRFVSSLPLPAARKLVRERRASEALQHKALVALIMLDRYLKNHE